MTRPASEDVVTWTKIDGDFHSHPKVRAVGNKAVGVYVRELSWSNAYGTDGRIVPADLSVFGATLVDAKALVRAGLWDVADGGWQVHDFADYQPTAESVNGHRSKRSEAARKAANVRWHGHA
jgi:hypothetical protein